MPIQKDDKVQVGWGHYKGQQMCKVAQVYRTKYVISIEWVQWEKANGITTRVGIHSSKDHKKILEHKAKSHQVEKEKGKYKEEIVEKMQE